MPYTEKEKKLMTALIKQYGLKKALQVYHAMENSGKYKKIFSAHSGALDPGLQYDDTKPPETPKPLAYGTYDEPQMIEQLSQVYSDWQGDPREKLVFLTKDGQLIPFQGQGKNEVSVKLEDIIRGLAYKGASLNNVVGVFHNHSRKRDFSPTDTKLLEALEKYGFAGGFHLYYPDVKRIKTYQEKKKSK